MMMMMMMMIGICVTVSYIDREFEFYEFFSFLKFYKFYEFVFSVEKKITKNS